MSAICPYFFLCKALNTPSRRVLRPANTPGVTASLLSFVLVPSAWLWQHHAKILEYFLFSSHLIHPLLEDSRYRDSLFFILLSFFFQGCKHHNKQPIYSDGLESFPYNSRKVREKLQKEKRKIKPPFFRKMPGLLPHIPSNRVQRQHNA